LKMNCATILMRTIDFADGVLTWFDPYQPVYSAGIYGGFLNIIIHLMEGNFKHLETSSAIIANVWQVSNRFFGFELDYKLHFFPAFREVNAGFDQSDGERL
jgi:hypothetical protein